MKRTVLTFFILLFPLISFAIEPMQRQVTVSGECNHTVTPDRASITLTVEFQDMDLSKATRDTTATYERVVAGAKKLNLKNSNLTTTEYNVFEIEEWENKRKVHKGYRVRMGLKVSTSEISRIGEVIALASKEKVQNVGALQTYLSDEKQLQEEVDCLSDAAKNAKLKAEKLTQSMGAVLGSVLSMNETGRTIPVWYPAMQARPLKAMMMAEDATAAPTIESGEQNLSLSIQVSFAIQ